MDLKSRSEIKRVYALAPDKVVAEIEGLRAKLAEAEREIEIGTSYLIELKRQRDEAVEALEWYECAGDLPKALDCGVRAREALARIKGEVEK